MNELQRAVQAAAPALGDWLTALCAALRAEAASLWQADAESNRLAVVLRHGRAGGPAPPGEVALRGHALGWVVMEGVSLRASRTDTFRSSGEGWIVAAPLAEPGGDTMGCVLVEFLHTPPPAATRTVELAATVAARLVANELTVRGTLADLSRYEALHAAAYELDRDLDLQELARSACRRARAVCGAGGSLVASWDAGSARGAVLAVDGAVKRQLVGRGIEAGTTFLALALANAAPLPRDDLRRRRRLSLYVSGADSEAGSAILTPILLGGRSIGGIAVEYARPRAYREGDVRRLAALARLIAPAFRNAVEFGAIRAESLSDPLTGLPNRRATERALTSALAVARGTEGVCAVAMLDIDHFKRINDRHGHAAGDETLRSVARTIRETLRPGDTAGRWGGEEFLVILPETSLAEAAGVAERVRRNVESAAHVAGIASITLSAGVSAFPETVRDQEELIASADAAMYRAKEAGRNRVIVARGSAR